MEMTWRWAVQANLQVKDWMHMSHISTGITSLLMCCTPLFVWSLFSCGCTTEEGQSHPWHAGDILSCINKTKPWWHCCLGLETCWSAFWIVHARGLRPRVNQRLAAHMAAASSDMLISDDFPSRLQREAATAEVRYCGEVCRTLPRAQPCFWSAGDHCYRCSVAFTVMKAELLWHLKRWQHLEKAQFYLESFPFFHFTVYSRLYSVLFIEKLQQS